MKHLVFLALIPLCCLHCKTAPEAGERKLECYVRYLATEGEVSAEATLREVRRDSAGSLPVELPGGIKFQQTEMKLFPIQGLSYRVRFPAGFHRDYTFEWRNERREPQRLPLTMSSIRAFGFESTPLKRAAPTKFTWQDDPLERGETLVFLWENLTGGATRRWEVYVNQPQNSIDFPAAKLAELDPGPWSLYLVRRKLVRDTLDGIPVSAVVEYYSDADTVAVQ
jgi:hypothetical protein